MEYYSYGLIGFSGVLLLSSLAASLPQIRLGILILFTIVAIILSIIGLFTVAKVRSLKNGMIKKNDIFFAIMPVSVAMLVIVILVFIGLFIAFA